MRGLTTRQVRWLALGFTAIALGAVVASLRDAPWLGVVGYCIGVTFLFAAALAGRRGPLEPARRSIA